MFPKLSLNRISFLLFLLFCFGETQINQINQTLPTYIKICHRKDPKLNECVKASIEHLKPFLSKGIPELHIPHCEPLLIPEINFSHKTGAVSVDSVYSNIIVHGPSNFNVRSVRVYINKDEFRLMIKFPELKMKSNYTIQGKLLMLPLHGRGTCHGNFSDIDAIAILKCQRTRRDGEEYLSVKNLKFEFHIGSVSIHLSDLFNGNKELGDAMNKLLNDKWRQLTKEIKPSLEEAIANTIKDTATKLFEKYPLDQILPV